MREPRFKIGDRVEHTLEPHPRGTIMAAEWREPGVHESFRMPRWRYSIAWDDPTVPMDVKATTFSEGALRLLSAVDLLGEVADAD